MYLFENPVLQYELVGNLRMNRAFVLLAAYLAALGAVVFLAWPQAERLDVANPVAALRLVNLFFLGQYLLVSLMAPSFAASAITSEKEHGTYEMLLASPLKPGAILLGKLLAALCHLALLIFCSLPIVVLCLPLGGISVYEVLAAYVDILLATVTFGVISLAASSFFRRTHSALAASYLIILPLALVGLTFWNWMGAVSPDFRLSFTFTLLPLLCLIVWITLWRRVSHRLLYPPDVGSEGKEVVDAERENQEAIGLIIRRGQFPDNLFAPAKRTDLLADHANPVFDKEMRSEIFAQGTLMLRVVIQIGMLLAIPLMAVYLYVRPMGAPWYVSYVILFNMLVGPVFSAATVTSERERETLDLLLTTVLSPWSILSAKLLSGLRVSSVLTLFLVWPLALASLMVYYSQLVSMLGYLAIILMTCLTTANVALFCSVLARRTSAALMSSYLALLLLFAAPLAAQFFAQTFFPESRSTGWLESTSLTSPFAAAFAVPLDLDIPNVPDRAANWPLLAGFFLFHALGNLVLVFGMAALFNTRWRVAQ
jgi:ABC-type transport system involved in multi-copper enzyme maturation permease subunit